MSNNTQTTKWQQRKTDANIELMAQTLNIKPITAQIMANRNIRTKNTAIKHLKPSKSFLNNPSLFKDIEKASSIIFENIRQHRKIAVYGDYDVDGVTSTVILYKTLKASGADVTYYIPHREHDGYGLNLSTSDKLIELGINLVITCDNGIASAAEIAYMNNNGIKTIVIDHHEPPAQIPEAEAIINPKQADCPYPFKSLCACGICYKFAEYFFRYINQPNPYEDEFLILASIATFCDVVDLTSENRIIAKLGLELLNNNKNSNLGLTELLKIRQLENKKIGAFEAGFIIGPCINATGRLDSASLSVDLFLTQDETQAKTLAARLYVLNDERKTLTANSVETILSELAETPQNDKVLVLYKPQIHESIAGIIAGRVKEATNRPTIILTKSGELAKGSARSIEPYNIFAELSKCGDLFERFGGHSMAAGLSLKESNITELRTRLNENCHLTDDDLKPVHNFDTYLPLSEATYELAEQLKVLEPFGKENPEPLFVTESLFTSEVSLIGPTGKTLRFTFTTQTPQGQTRYIKALAFNKLEQFMQILKANYSDKVCENFKNGSLKNLTVKLDLLYALEINEYNGNTSVQLNIKDFKI